MSSKRSAEQAALSLNDRTPIEFFRELPPRTVLHTMPRMEISLQPASGGWLVDHLSVRFSRLIVRQQTGSEFDYTLLRDYLSSGPDADSGWVTRCVGSDSFILLPTCVEHNNPEALHARAEELRRLVRVTNRVPSLTAIALRKIGQHSTTMTPFILLKIIPPRTFAMAMAELMTGYNAICPYSRASYAGLCTQLLAKFSGGEKIPASTVSSFGRLFSFVDFFETLAERYPKFCAGFFVDGGFAQMVAENSPFA